MPRWNRAVTRLIKVPYWIALGLIGLFVTVSFMATIWAIEAHRERFASADLAAQQSLSSQRVPYLATELVSATDDKSRQAYRRALQSVLRNMERRHAILSLRQDAERIPANMRSILHEIYYSGFRSFDAQMSRFLADAQAVAKADDTELRPDMPQLVRLRNIAANGLLKTYGLMYSLLRRQALGTLNQFLWVAGALWLLTLALIIVEVPLIFRPMAGRTAQSLRTLDSARQEAEEQTAREAEREDKIVYMRIMGHEMRTPLNAILGMIELLRMSGLPPKQADYAEQIEEAAQHLLNLVNHVLEFRELEANLVRLQLGPTSLVEELEQVIDEFRQSTEEKGLELNWQTDGILADYYLADGQRIQQTLRHLVGNALKFTEEGAVEVRLRYAGAVGADADLVRFEVEDTGVGVPPILKEHIFKEWRQADDTLARKYGGTGLGLSIARGLVELMDGEIGLESSEGKGSLFWFTVPLARMTGHLDAGEVAPKAVENVKKAS